MKKLKEERLLEIHHFVARDSSSSLSFKPLKLELKAIEGSKEAADWWRLRRTLQLLIDGIYKRNLKLKKSKKSQKVKQVHDKDHVWKQIQP